MTVLSMNEKILTLYWRVRNRIEIFPISAENLNYHFCRLISICDSHDMLTFTLNEFVLNVQALKIEASYSNSFLLKQDDTNIISHDILLIIFWCHIHFINHLCTLSLQSLCVAFPLNPNFKSMNPTCVASILALFWKHWTGPTQIPAPTIGHSTFILFCPYNI